MVSTFFGGGSIEIGVAKELGIEVIGFELFDILVNYRKIQIEKPFELYKELLKLKPDKKFTNWLKKKKKINQIKAEIEKKMAADSLVKWVKESLRGTTAFEISKKIIKIFEKSGWSEECVEERQKWMISQIETILELKLNGGTAYAYSSS